MIKKSRRWILIPLILTGMVMFSILSSAQGPGCWMRWSGPWVPEKYQLTEEQQRKIEEIHSKYDEKILPLEKELSSKRLELRTYAYRPDVELEKIKALQKDIRDLEGRIEDLRLDAQAEVSEILTKEQREYFGGFYSFWGRGHGWPGYCPMMRGYRGWKGQGPISMGWRRRNPMEAPCRSMSYRR